MYNMGKREEKGQRRQKGQWHCVHVYLSVVVSGVLSIHTLTQIMVTNGV